jgi:hypothetical protein
MSANDLSSMVVRRERSNLPGGGYTPAVVHARAPELPEQDFILQALLSLPPPVPPADGGDGGALTIFSLVRQWSSSSAALRRALQRRLARGIAVQSALENGVLPLASDLRSWCAGDEAVQLPLFGLLQQPAAGSQAGDERVLLAAVTRHIDGIRDVAALLSKTGSDLDDARWNALQQIVDVHEGEKVLAFTQYEETARALFKRSLQSKRSAMLTASSSMIASGRIPRAEVISLFAPGANGRGKVPANCTVNLLICTDILSEGANLQDASVVVHLDLPWTPVRLTQRVGRAARLGSQARQVTVYTMPPPASAELLLRMERRLAAKLSVAARTVGIAGTVLPLLHLPAPSAASVPQLASQLRDLLRELGNGGHAENNPKELLVAAVDLALHAENAEVHFLALLDCGVNPQLVAGRGDWIDERISTCNSVLCALKLRLHAGDLKTRIAPQRDIEKAHRLLGRFTAMRDARLAAGIPSAAYAQSRKRLIRRLDTIAMRAPVHTRPSLHKVVARARRVATAAFGDGAERVLAELATAQMPDDSWLRAIEAFGEAQIRRSDGGSAPQEVRAILLLRQLANTRG